jgi:hypothetical protein
MRALLENARRHLASVRDELVHQQADARARNRGKPSRSLTEQTHHVDEAIDSIDEAIEEEGSREKAREHRPPTEVDLDALRAAR